MVAESHACLACHEPVPPGRLSCPHCGTVLAAVARPHGEASPAAAAPAAPKSAPWFEVRPATTPPATSPPPAASDDAQPESEPEPDTESEGEPVVAPWTEAPVEAHPPAAPGAWLPPAPSDQPEAPPAPERATPDVLRSVPTAPAKILPRAWDPAAAAADATGDPATDGSTSMVRPARRWRIEVPQLDWERIDDGAGLVVLTGSMGSAIGFLLPWASPVIGAGTSDGYTSEWGLGSPGHVLVFLLVVGALALAAVPNPVPSWFRSGVVGLVLGGLVLGLVWPYTVGPLDGGIGAILVFVSSLLLVVGGLVAAFVRRHAGPPPAV